VFRTRSRKRLASQSIFWVMGLKPSARPAFEPATMAEWHSDVLPFYSHLGLARGKCCPPIIEESSLGAMTPRTSCISSSRRSSSARAARAGP
jgi:hypothetical protein